MANNIKHINKSMLEQGLVFKKQGQKLAGHTDKGIFRVHDNSETFDKKREERFGFLDKKPQNSLYFGGLFRALMQKNCHYVTYLNGEFVGKKKSEIELPDDVECAVKEISAKNNLYKDTDMFYFGEVVGSRLSNLMGISTVYNVAFEDEDSYKKQRAKEMGWGDYVDYKYLFSVNFLAEGYLAYSFEDLGFDFNDQTPISVILEQVEAGYNGLCKFHNISTDPKSLASIKKEMTRHYLFRTMFCEDGDWSAKNSCLMVSPEGNVSMGPGFDYEYLSRGRRARSYFRETAMQNLTIIKAEIPEIFNAFLAKCEEVVANGKLEDVVHNALVVKERNKENVHNIYERLVANVEMLREVSNTIDKKSKVNDYGEM